MDLKEIASVSGKSGLYKVVKPTRTGIILETIDEKKKKIVANANSRVSLLKEISIYTTSEEGSVNLGKVFQAINSKKGSKVEVATDNDSLYDFLGEVVNDFDKERVYPNDIKKLVSWYNTLSEFYPEVLTASVEEEPEDAEETADKKEKKD